jgi:hypothetical protein
MALDSVSTYKDLWFTLLELNYTWPIVKRIHPQ